QGLLRVVRRDRGIRVYAVHQHEPRPESADERRARLDALVDAVVNIYAPLPARSLAQFVRRLRFAAPQWSGELTAALHRAKERLGRAHVDGIDWFWPADEDPRDWSRADDVRLLAPFDPVVKDRDRFERLWGWVYRFEAYTPPAKRIRGYYALPLLWRDRIIGWANLSMANGALRSDVGFVATRPRETAFRRALDAEVARIRAFLGRLHGNMRDEAHQSSLRS
ncbi:MAG TPA: crosslink repair DNA glycosylase YcaQ family protein, partial [Rhodanobacteraceae bacterium]